MHSDVEKCQSEWPDLRNGFLFGLKDENNMSKSFEWNWNFQWKWRDKFVCIA